MAITEIIAAVELSSSRIAGIAGQKTPDGALHILAYVQENATSFVHKGLVYNIDKAAQAIASIVDRLNAQLDNLCVTKVYAAIGGMSLHTQKNAVSRTIEGDTVSQALVDSICDENLTYPVEDMDILDVAPQEYRIDNTRQVDAVGVAGHNITGQFLNIVARTALKKNLEQSFQHADVEIAELLIAPIAQAKAVLTETEMRSGCALVDFGATTTTISVYKSNLLRYLAVVPLGGNNITRDITALKVEEGEAEQLKLTYGDAYYEEEESDTPAVCTLSDGRMIELATLNDFVAARTDEIIDNVWNLIQYSGYADHLLSGIVFAGGGSNLKNIDEIFRKRTKQNKVRIAPTVQAPLSGHKETLKNDGTCCTIVALLVAGRDNCVKPKEMSQPVAPQPDDTPTVTPPQPDLFENDEGMRRLTEEIRIRRQKEEEEKKEKEKKEKTGKTEKGGKEKNGKSKGLSKWWDNVTKTFFEDSEM